MTAAPSSRQASRPVAQRSTEESRGLIGLTFRLAMWLVLSLVISIVAEWIGMTFWWEDQGVRHSERMLAEELGYLSGDLRQTLVVSDTAAYARAFADAAYEWLWVRTRLIDLISWAAAPVAPDAGYWRSTIHELYSLASAYVVAAINTTQVFAARVAVLTLSMPAFLLSGLVGGLDGMVKRDLRRWGGGRESSFVYHHARRWIAPVFLAAWVLYLALPFSVHPAVAVLPFAAAFGWLVALTASSFKKYL